MYQEHFGLRELPFTLTPNTHFYLNLPTHQEAFNLIMVALENGDGFVKIVGEVGTGKTLLCRKVLNALSDDFISDGGRILINPLSDDLIFCLFVFIIVTILAQPLASISDIFFGFLLGDTGDQARALRFRGLVLQI